MLPVDTVKIRQRARALKAAARLPAWRTGVVFGRVIGIHISDDVLTDGMVDLTKFKPIARLGYMDYTRVDLVFTLAPPD